MLMRVVLEMALLAEVWLRVLLIGEVVRLAQILVPFQEPFLPPTPTSPPPAPPSAFPGGRSHQAPTVGRLRERADSRSTSGARRAFAFWFGRFPPPFLWAILGEERLRLPQGRIAGRVAEVHVAHQRTEPTDRRRPAGLSTTRNQIGEEVRKASAV